MYIQEVARQSGISVRTLRYYDEIGLLHPDEVSQAGYRIYREPALRRLQRILFYRELDFPLSDIKQLLDRPDRDETGQMVRQLELLKLRQARLSRIIGLLEKQLKGEDRVSIKEFNVDEIKAHEEKYRAEVEKTYGDSEAYRVSQARSAGYQAEDWQQIKQQTEAIYHSLSELRMGDPAQPEAQDLIKQWQDLISQYFYPCSNEMLAGLGELYQHDDRFRQNIDQYGEGLTDFLVEAIKIYTAAK